MQDKASSEGSQKRKELKTKEVDKIDMKNTEYESLSLNFFELAFKDNIKNNHDEEVLKTALENSYKYNGEEFRKEKSEIYKEYKIVHNINEKVKAYRESKAEKEKE